MPPFFAKTALNDLLIALSLLTRLPLPQADWSDKTRPAARAGWAYPLAGLAVATGATCAAWMVLGLGMPSGFAALVFLLCMVVTTGAMHEDGLADCADGFWGGWERARRLEIMKDSAIGTYGVLALVFSMGARVVLYATLISAGLLAAPGWSFWTLVAPAVLSRTAMVCVMQALPHARSDGLSASTGHPGKPAVAGALLIGCAVLILAGAAVALPVLVAASVAAGVVALIARAKIGGQTGDVLGATQQISEIAVLMALIAAL
jgi:adenosylcobinamide-GDP ribazoletransferase